MTTIRPPAFSLSAVAAGLFRLSQYGDLAWTLSVHRIRVRYKQSVLGIAWALCYPVSIMVIFTVFFSLVGVVPSEGKPYPVFAYAGLVTWTCFSSALTTSTHGLTSHSHVISKVYFPREVLPFTYVMAALFDLIIALAGLGLLLAYYGLALTLSALYAVPIILVLAALSLAAALLLSAAHVRTRDVGVALPLVLQLWMFATPVIYPLSAVPEAWRAWYILNPLVGIVESFRRVVLHGLTPDFHLLGLSAFTAAVALPLAYAYFKRVEATMADVI